MTVFTKVEEVHTGGLNLRGRSDSKSTFLPDFFLPIKLSIFESKTI